MNTELKQKFYNILTSDLGYTVCDTPPSKDTVKYPWVRLTMGNITRDYYNGNFTFNYSFYVDIFSDYNGEKEVLEMEESIFSQLTKLYEIQGVTYVREVSFKVMDDKSLGPVRKHGSIKYTVLCNGELKEV